MRRRTYTTLALLAAITLLVGWLPSSPWLHGRIASALTDAAAGVGFDVRFLRVEGYAWRGLTLIEPTVRGDGLDIAAERIRVDWFLPALVVGELPLRLDVRGLRGDVELTRLNVPAATGAAPPAVRPRFDAIRLEGADLTIAEVPFALPDLRIDALTAVSLDDGRWRVATTLATDEGRLSGVVVGRFGEGGLEIELTEADARVARHWWDGIEGGTVSGAMTWGPEGADGRFVVRDGSLTYVGTTVTELVGPIAWRGATIEAAVAGATLGGRIDVAGTVDVDAAVWRADGQVAVDLPAASRDLVALLGAPGFPAATEGTVRGRVAVEGWTTATIAADLTLAGDWLGSRLEVPGLRVGFTPLRGLSVSADGRWGAGDLRLRTEARDDQIVWRADAGPLVAFDVPLASVEAEWTTGGGPVAGRALLSGGAGPWAAEADVVLDAEGLQAFVTGSLWSGAFEGALASRAALDAAVEGGLAWSPPDTHLTGSPRVEARISGSLGAPTARVTLSGEGPVAPRVGAPRAGAPQVGDPQVGAPQVGDPQVGDAAPEVLGAIGAVTAWLLPGLDLRGELDAGWSVDGAWVEGRLGPASFRGDGEVWSVDLAALALGGPLAGRLGPGSVAWRSGAWSANVVTEVATAVRAGGDGPAWVATPPIAWAATGDAGGGSATDAAGLWQVSVRDGIRISAADAEVFVLDRPARLDGAWLDGVAEGQLGLDAIALRGRWADGRGDGSVRTGAEALDWSWFADLLSLDGSVDLAAAGDLFAPLFGAALADVAGDARVAASWRIGVDPVPTGSGSIALVAPAVGELALEADGETVRWRGRVDAPLEPLSTEGTWAPERARPIDGRIAWGGLGAVTVGLDGATGTGTWSGWRGGEVEVAPQPWRLDVDLDGRARAAFGDSRATFDPELLRVDVELDLGVGWGGEIGRLTGRAAWSADADGGAPDGTLDARWSLADDLLARLTGGLQGVTADIEGSAARWAAGATPLLGPNGEAALAGDLAGVLTWRPDVGLRGDARWVDRSARGIAIGFDGDGVRAAGEDWSILLDATGSVMLAAREARIDPLLRRGDLGAVLDGDLRVAVIGDAAGTGDGELHVSLDGFGGGATGRIWFAEGASLRAAADVTYGPVDVHADGALDIAANPGWRGTWTWSGIDALPTAGSGRFSLDAAGVAAEGVLSAAAGSIGPLSWPDLGLAVALDPSGAWRATGRSGLAGDLATGLTLELALAGDPLAAALRPDASGWRIDVSGADLAATWVGDLADWALSGQGRAVGLGTRVEAVGSGVVARGRWTLGSAEWGSEGDGAAAWAAGSLALDGTTLDLDLQGADLDLGRVLGLEGLDVDPVAGSISGRVDPGGWSVDGALTTTATAAGVAAEVALTVRDGSVELAVAGEAGGVPLRLSAAGGLGALPDTAWDLQLQVADVQLSGGFALRGVEEATLELRSDDGAWRLLATGLERGSASLSGPASLEVEATWAGRPVLELQLQGGIAGVAFDADLRTSAAGATSLRVGAAASDGGWQATLFGPVAPLDLRGDLAIGGPSLPLTLSAAPTWRLRWGEIEATQRNGGVELRGSTAPGQLPYVQLAAAPLAWSPADGWSGEGRASADTAFGVAAIGTLRGDGDLHADVVVTRDGRDAGRATLSLAADPREGIRGQADLAVPLAPPEATPWTLYARGPLEATGAGWGGELAIELLGPVHASGRAAIRDAAVEARLDGDGLTFEGSWAAGAGTGRLRIEDVDAGAFLPWLTEPRLSGEGRVDLAADGAAWRIDAVRLDLPSGGIDGTGVGSRDGRVQASLRFEVDLADVAVGEAWSGRISGPLTFDGTLAAPLDGTIAARLEARDVAWEALDATWQGDVLVSGSAGDPVARATWVARGPAAHLDGEASWAPAAGRSSVRADGTVVGAAVDVDLALGPAGFDGRGEVRWAGTAWSLAADEGRLSVIGREGWAGWQATLDPDGWQAGVAGDLSALPYAAGTFAGVVDLGVERRPRIALTWADLELGGVELGAGVASGDAASGWQLDGERWTASLSGDATRWQVAVREVATPLGDTALSLDARADPDGRAVDARWTGETPAGSVDLRLALDDGSGAWRGALTGLALGGRIAWPVALIDGRWSGQGRLEGAAVAGRPLAATLDLAGAMAAPEFDLGIVAGPAGAWRADLSWAQGAARVGLVAPLPDGGVVTARGRAWPDVDIVLDGGAAGRVRATAGWSDDPLRLDGELDLGIGPLRLALSGPTTVRLSIPELSGGLRATLPARPLAGAIEEVRREGWRWIGDGDWSGALRLGRAEAPWVEVSGLSFGWNAVRATVDGWIDPTAADVDVVVDLASLATGFAGAGTWPWSDPVRGRLTWDGAALEAVSDGPWSSRWRIDPAARTASVAVDVRGAPGAGAPEPVARGELRLDDAGWAGDLRVETVTDALGQDPTAIDVRVTGAGAHLALAATLRGPRGSATASGRWDAAELRPAGWGPTGAPLREFDARVVGLDLAGFAGAQALAGSVTGSATLRGDALFGRLATDALTLGGRTAPAQLEFQGDVDADAGPRLSGRLDIGGAEADLLVDRRGIEAYVRLERFPLHELVAAAFGPSDVVAEVTGAMRGAWAWGAVAPSDLRVASERIRLERAGVETRGQLSFEWDGESLTIGEAAFEGRGEWRVRGRATPDLLDLELLASAADFGPLLGLVPTFAQYGVTAQGDLALSARGTPAAPDVLLRTEDLELGVAGTRYRLEDVRVTLQGEAWTGRAEIVAVAPLTGRVTMVSDGRVGPFPAGTFSLAARAIGALDVPFVGRVDELVADLAWTDQQAPTLRAAGRMGAPFAVTGSLSPLDLHATGRDLNLAIPFLFVADATVDADLRLRASNEGVNLSGRVDASQARVDLAARQGAASVDDAAPSAATDTGAPEPGPAVVGDARERFRFDAVRIVAPQRVTFSESFGNAEAAVDLTLDGTAAAPRLSGAIRALRGAVRFAGRDLELSEAVATFDPTRGVLPSLSVVGRTSFDKARVVPPGEAIRFLAPAGPRFTVELQLAGEATLGTRGFALDLQPRLTSDALVDGVDAGGARPLSELELLTLVTLGRLEGSAGVAGAVAQSALDTAVELLVTAEIQAILAEALGVDVVELRTTTVSTLLDGTDPFGVSLRLGGYLSEEVFASYRVSTLGGATFSNEVAFAYQLGPVAVDITGRIDVAAGAAATTPSLAVGARYGFAPGWALELGIDLSTERSTARLGVTWRW